MSDQTLDKTTLRRLLLADRQAISAEVRRRWDATINERVLAWWSANPAQVIGVYWPIRGEPDLRLAYAELARRGVRLALPLVQRDAPLRFAAWAPGDELVKDALGVPVPLHDDVLVRPDALLIPCVGFNAHNRRLGYGGGFYDRTLAMAPRPLAVGIAYASGRCEFDSAAHDVAMDDIITEQSPPAFAPLSL